MQYKTSTTTHPNSIHNKTPFRYTPKTAIEPPYHTKSIKHPINHKIQKTANTQYLNHREKSESNKGIIHGSTSPKVGIILKDQNSPIKATNFDEQKETLETVMCLEHREWREWEKYLPIWWIWIAEPPWTDLHHQKIFFFCPSFPTQIQKIPKTGPFVKPLSMSGQTSQIKNHKR